VDPYYVVTSAIFAIILRAVLLETNVPHAINVNCKELHKNVEANAAENRAILITVGINVEHL
jgi:hypothetical protein